MNAAKRIEVLDEGGIFARIDKHILPDLDDVLFEMAEYLRDRNDWTVLDWDDDLPTRVGNGEPTIGHHRISPCWCGDHSWHIDPVHEDEDGMPDRPSGRGAFLAVMFG